MFGKSILCIAVDISTVTKITTVLFIFMRRVLGKKIASRLSGNQIIRGLGYQETRILGGREENMAGFENLRIWQEAYNLMLEIHNVVRLLPREEYFKLRNQIERSSSSVADNIAEGYSSFYYKDKLKGMYIARKEAGETQNHIRKMQGKGYVNGRCADMLVNRYEGLIKGINGYIRFINNKRRLNNQRNKIGC